MIGISKKQSYKTVKGFGEAVYIDRKSKFIAHTKPVKSEQEALEFLQEMRSTYSDANHNVYAYIIDENNISRYSDDGEPSGTSGLPVLDVMRKEGIVDVVTVVTRYFGGTLLGTGGLVHAYSFAASEAVKNAGKITKVLCDCFDVFVDYALSGKVKYLISSKEYFLEDTQYSDKVKFGILVKKEDAERFIKDMSETCSGKEKIVKKEEKYIDIGKEE